MTSQQVLFAETIAAMKKARKRKAYESDSDSEIYYHGNRGHKLMKRARFVHEGQLAPPSGPEVYKEVVNHAGFHRAIISRNPILIDDEGYEIDSDDDQEYVQDVAEAAAEFNPYANIRLQNILAPLTAVTDLPTHPTLSRPYTTKTLTDLAKQSCNIMHKENAALWRVKHLQTKLVGDHIWAPCEIMLGSNDIELYRDDYMDYSSRAHGSVKSDATMLPLEDARSKSSNNVDVIMKNGGPVGTDEAAITNGEKPSADVPMVDAETTADTETDQPEPSAASSKANAEGHKQNAENNEQNGTSSKPEEKSAKSDTAEDKQNAIATASNGVNESHTTGSNSGLAGTDGVTSEVQGEADKADKAVQHNQVNKEVEHEGSRAVSVMSEFTDDPPIHPLFLPPRSAHPDRDLGIPEAEAEDMRRLLQLYVQKQEEVCRGAKRLYEGLLRADRMRKTVLQWSKYEAHVGPNRDMSDGEDWYDKEEWGLEDDLKKGQDEEEEDTTQTTKKTRTRR